MKVISKFSKKDLWSIPNILCYIRLLLIPVFVVLYINASSPDDYFRAAAVVFLSGVTDFLDGFIARRFNMVTELGKIIDPLADKLTQVALMFVLVVKIRNISLLIILFVIMQLFLIIAGILMLKKGKKLNGAKWFGKISTTVFYATMLVLVSFPNLSERITNILILLCSIFLALSFFMYIREYLLMYRELKEVEETGLSEKQKQE